MSLFFLNKMAEVVVQRISVVFRSFLPLGTFPACWRQANVTSILKTPSSSPVVNFWAIFITPVLSKVFERLVCSQLVPTSQFSYWKYLGTCDPLLCVSHGTLQSAFYSDQVARFVQIDFSIASRESTIRVILYKICYVGNGGSVLSILTKYLSNRSQHVMLDGCRSKLVNIVSGVVHESIFGFYCSSGTPSSFFFILLIDNSDDFTLIAVVPAPGVRSSAFQGP